MRTAADFLGMLVYLGVMYGGLPDRELLSATFEASIKGPADTPVGQRSEQRLRLVKTPTEAAPEAIAAAPSEEVTRSSSAA